MKSLLAWFEFEEGVVIGHQQTEHFVLVCDGQFGFSEVDDFLEASQCREERHRHRTE